MTQANGDEDARDDDVDRGSKDDDGTRLTTTTETTVATANNAHDIETEQIVAAQAHVARESGGWRQMH